MAIHGKHFTTKYLKMSGVSCLGDRRNQLLRSLTNYFNIIATLLGKRLSHPTIHNSKRRYSPLARPADDGDYNRSDGVFMRNYLIT